MEKLEANIQDIVDTLKEEAKNDQVADLANASIDVVLATAKLIGLYKDYYSKGCKKFLHNGESHTLSEWAEITGIPVRTLRKRITTNHWDIADALNTPVQNPALGRNFKMQVTVLQYNYKRELIREFKSISETARQLGIDSSLVKRAIEGMDPLEQVARFGFYLQTPRIPTQKEIEETISA